MSTLVDELGRRLQPLGVVLRLSTARRRPVALRRTDGRGAELRVHPLVFALEDVVPLLERFARSEGRDGDRDLRRLGAAVVAALDGLDQPPARCFLPVLTAAARERLVSLDDQLARRGVRLELNDNRRLLLSLRHDRAGGLSLGIHYELLEEPDSEILLLHYVARHGRGRHRELDLGLNRVFERIGRRHQAPVAAVPLELSAREPVGQHFDLQALAAAVHATWFADLPPIIVGWGRDPGSTRQLRSIHFGTFRSRPRPEIRIHPRLGRP